MRFCDAPGCERPLTGKQTRYCCPAHKTASVRARKAGTGTRRRKPSGAQAAYFKAKAELQHSLPEPWARVAVEALRRSLPVRQRERVDVSADGSCWPLDREEVARMRDAMEKAKDAADDV